MIKVSEILRVKGDALYTVSPDTPVTQVVDTMSVHDIGSLVVMEFGELVGMLTFREISAICKRMPDRWARPPSVRSWTMRLSRCPPIPK